MKSSIKVSRGGRSITFRGGAARAAFESLTGQKLPPREMNPNRFTIGERVSYENHVTGSGIATLEVVALEGDFVLCRRLLSRGEPFKFHSDGRATWSSNLSICHENQPNPHAEKFRARDFGW